VIWGRVVVLFPLFSFLGTTALWLGLWFCFHWRQGLWALAGLMVFAALFYAEEDWRGSHAWNQFRRAREAKGERFDWASVLPPPVPADQNFALTPLVFSSYGQMLDRNGHEIRPPNTNLVNRLEMSFCDQDHIPFSFNGWTLGKPTDLAALQRYYRTLATPTNLFPVPLRPQSPAADVLLALSRFDPTLGELRQAVELPDSRFPLNYDRDNKAAILLPHLPPLKRCAQVLVLRATAELQTGRSDDALADIKLLQRLSDSIRTEPFLVSHIVRIRMVEDMLQPVWEGLADHRWNEAQLASLNADLSELDFLADYERSMHGEMGLFDADLHHWQKQPGQFMELLNCFGVNRSEVFGPADTAMARLMQWHLVPSGWLHENELNCARTLEKFYFPAVEVPTHTVKPSLARQGKGFVNHERADYNPDNVLAGFLMNWSFAPDFPARFAHAQSSVDLARVAIALERCRQAQGRYPRSLDTLVPQYIEEVPHDVIGGQPLHYRLSDDGRFVLYSVGWNETDDGGGVGQTPGNSPPNDISPAQDIGKGDWVWRYP
jgi:hypothetical protein